MVSRNFCHSSSFFSVITGIIWTERTMWPYNEIQSILNWTDNWTINIFNMWSDRMTLFNDIPGCLFTRTPLPKSSNNLEPICNYVNIKCSLLVILRIISVTSTFTVCETYTENVNLTNLKIIFFSNTIVFNCLKCAFHTSTFNCLRGLVVSVEDSCFGGCGFEPQPNLLLCWFYFIFYWWIVFTELFRYIL